MNELDEAERAHKGGDYDKAYAICIKLAAEGNPEARYHLGLYFEYGFSVEKDRKVSYEYFKQAAGEGNQPARDKLKMIELNFEAYMRS